MRATLYFVLAGAAICGCDSLNKPKVDNPVMEPPPPRISSAQEQFGESLSPEHPQYPRSDNFARKDGGLSAEVQTASFESNAERLSDNTVVATVDGAPIFAGEVLERAAAGIAKMAETMPAEQLHNEKLNFIRHELNGHIERKLLVEALRATLKPEQIEALDGHIDTLFAEKMEVMKDELGVSSRHELELAAQKQGTTLGQLRDAFAAQLMAVEFLSSKSRIPDPPGRLELLAYYREHIEDYSFPVQVRWQQIVISFDRGSARKEALDKLERAVVELRQGADFGEVARKYSDGPRAEQGGQWDWTQTGSLADTDLEQTLFRLEPGTISSVIEGDKDFRLVKVTQRREAGQTPFQEVQNEIKKLLEQRMRREAGKAAMTELREGAVVKTMFDPDWNASRPELQ